MIQFVKRFRLVFILALTLQLVGMPLRSNAAEVDISGPTWVTPIHYLALGDSLAFGINADGMPGKGYSDFLAQSLQGMKMLKSSNKGFAYPGYTASDILKDLSDNVTKPIVGIGQEGQNVALHTAIQEANLVTISVGANDILKHLKIDPESGKPEMDMAQLTTAIKQVGVNYHQMLKSIYELNPDVQVYVMGYYNPFPTLAAEYQPQLTQLVTGLNGSIQAGMKGTPAIFVSTSERIASDFQAYLPNPKNIHLSEAGYQVVADEFANLIKTTYSWVAKDALTVQLKGKDTATLTWKPAVDTKNIIGYAIYANGERVAQIAGDVYSTDIKNLEESKKYTFVVSAINDAKVESVLNPSATITIGDPQPLFKDIHQHWAKDFIMGAVGLGMLKGHSDGTFKPDHTLTRAQAASIIVRSLKLKADQPAPFTDIANYPKEIQAEIAAAYQFGIVKGYNGKFDPSENVTRSQLALMIHRSYVLAKGEAYSPVQQPSFSDISNLDFETKIAISLLDECKIVEGSNGEFVPNNATTRGEAAKMLVNFSKLMNKGL